MNNQKDKFKEKIEYRTEKDEFILDLDKDRYNRYLHIINNTREYKEILDSIPSSFNNLEKSYYVYTKLGKILQEDSILVYDYFNKMNMYYDTIRENGFGNCRQMSELYASMLKSRDIIDNFFLTKRSLKLFNISKPHIDAILSIDGKLYLTDIIRDTINMRSGIRNIKFRI